MKTLGFLGLALLLSASVAVAEQASSEAQTEGDLQAVIRGPEDIAVGRTIILDASSSRVAGESVQYRWYIGDSFQPISRTLEAVYTPERPGSLVFRLAIHSVVNGEARESEARHAVIVFERKIVLLADATVSEDKLMLHVQSAAAAGVHLQVLQPPPGSTPLGTEEALLSLLSERSAAFAGAETTVIWTDTIAGLQALMRAAEGDRGAPGSSSQSDDRPCDEQELKYACADGSRSLLGDSTEENHRYAQRSLKSAFRITDDRCVSERYRPA